MDFYIFCRVPLGEQQNNLHLSGRVAQKQTQCHKGRHKRKLVNNDGCCHHDVMERCKKLIYEVKNNEKLGDDYINAANQLLCSQFEELQGLSSTSDWSEIYLFKSFTFPY